MPLLFAGEVRRALGGESMHKDVSQSRVLHGVAQRHAGVPGGALSVSTIPPRTTVPLHHHAEAQLGFAVDGALHIGAGEGWQRTDPSRAYVLGAGVLHRWRNDGDRPIRTFDVEVLLPSGRYPIAERSAGVAARSSGETGRAGFSEFQFPFGVVRHRLLAPGEELVLEPPSRGASYVAEVPARAGGGEEARIVAFTAPHRAGSSGGVHVVEVRLLPDAPLISECSRLGWRDELQPRAALVIEENDVARRTLVSQFEWAGFRTFEAAKCCAGVEVAAEQYPEIILLDCDLGGGAHVDEALACLASGTPLSKIVAVTARGSLASASAIIRRGASAYLPKPTTAELVLAALHQPTEPRPARGARPFTLSRASWEYLQAVVESARSRAEAARRLGIQPRSLRRMLSKNAPAR